MKELPAATLALPGPISKADRRRQSRKRSLERRTCNRKVAYPTEASAHRGALEMSAKQWRWFSWYRCPIGSHWHVARDRT